MIIPTTFTELMNYIDIKKLSVNTIIAYVISWGYFFLSLPFMTKLVGIARATTLNYLISWGIMISIIYVLQTIHFDSIV